MQELFSQIATAWNTLTLKQRASLVLSAAITVAAVAGIVWWAKQPTWAVLYTGLDPRDAQAAVQELQTRKTPLRLTDGGTTIEVPLEQVDSLRMELAAKSIVGSGRFGFMEMFAQDNIAQSNQSARIRYQKALEDELARTIESLAEVRSARVHLVLPGDRVFVDDKDVAKASVTLALAPGAAPAGEQVQAIARIVAGAVPELSIGNVSVLDTAGHVLWEGDGEGGGIVAARQVELKAAMERDINAKVGRVLEPLVGGSGFVVKTSAELDFQKIVRREKNIDPNSGVLISEEKTKERQSSSLGGAYGVPGTASNLPGSSGGGGGPGGDSNERQDQRNNYEYSVVERTVEQPVGEIRRLSVAVLVDQRWEEIDNSGQKEQKSSPRSDDEISRIEDLVKAAISFDASRGDVVTVEQAPFQHAPVPVEEKKLDVREWLPLVKYPALILLSLLVFLLFFRPMLTTVRQALRTAAAASSPMVSGGSASVQQPPLIGASKIELMRQRLAALANEQPEGMAQTVRVWLHEGRERERE